MDEKKAVLYHAALKTWKGRGVRIQNEVSFMDNL
jgi:hypothetical protein